MASRARCRARIAPRAGCRHLSAQRGQALVLAMVLLFAGCLGLFFMFSTGQLSSTRQRLDNAADAAAYSAALWRARVMNYHAYSNRAIVAQEVAIAQAVTLASWARYFDQFTANASTVSAAFPPVAGVLQTAAQLAHAASLVTEETASEEIAARDTYKTLLASSQEVLQMSVDTFGLGAVANEVARASDRRFFAFALPDGGAFSTMSRRYEDADRSRLKGVVDASLDDFVKGPRGMDMTLYPLPSACFGNPFAGVGSWFHQLLKRGGTVMAPDYQRWEAADTLSLHGWWPSFGWFGWFKGCNRFETLPLGWGAAQADDGSVGNLLMSNPGNVGDNPRAASLAEGAMSGGGWPGFSAYSGTPVVRELAYEHLANTRFPVSDVAVLARVAGDDARTANALNVGVGRLRLAENLAGARLWSLSAAQVYFRRPAGEPVRQEYASLYAPYWQVRLVEPSTAQRAIADGYVH